MFEAEEAKRKLSITIVVLVPETLLGYPRCEEHEFWSSVID